MIETPGDTPVTMPVDELTTAAAVLLLLQVPPGDGHVNVTGAKGQKVDEPETGAGSGLLTSKKEGDTADTPP